MKSLVRVLLLLFILQLPLFAVAEAGDFPLPPPEPTAQAPEVDPASPFVVRIEFTDDASLATLTGVLDIWEVNHAERYVIAMITPEQGRWLNLLGYIVQVDEAKSAVLNRPLVRSAGQTAGIPGYACYRTVEETYETLAALAADYPDIAEWKDIGDSYDKATAKGPAGFDIQALVLTNKASSVEKGKFVLLAAVHARELTTAELATRFAERLVSGYGIDADLTWLLDYNEIHIIAQGNPDGRAWAEQGYSWRKNTNNPDTCGFPFYGIDLNRNGSFLWASCPGGACSSADPCSIVHRGAAPASEPETKAVEDYLHTVFADQRGEALADPAPLETNGILISLHSYGNLVIYPWDWTGENAPNMQELRRLGRKFGYFNRYSVCNTSNCLYAVDGSHTDYAYGVFGVAAYTFELGTAFFQSCSYFEDTMLEPQLNALTYAAKAARRPYQVAAGPDTVDVVVSAGTVTTGTSVSLSATATDIRYFSNGYGVEPEQAIAAVRYTVDLPSWAGGEPIALSPQDGEFDSSVEVAEATIGPVDWPPGRHTIFVESQDTDGNWGPPSAISLHIRAAHGFEVEQQPPPAPVGPGQEVVHTVTITNTGSTEDQFVLTLEAHEWPTVVAAITPTLAVDEGIQLPITVTVPTTATTGATDVATVRIDSLSDPTLSQVITLSTTVDAEPPSVYPLYFPSILHGLQQRIAPSVLGHGPGSPDVRALPRPGKRSNLLRVSEQTDQ